MTPPTRLFSCSYSATKDSADFRSQQLKMGACTLAAPDEDAARGLAESKAKASFPTAHGFTNHFAVASPVPEDLIRLAAAGLPPSMRVA